MCFVQVALSGKASDRLAFRVLHDKNSCWHVHQERCGRKGDFPSSTGVNCSVWKSLAMCLAACSQAQSILRQGPCWRVMSLKPLSIVATNFALACKRGRKRRFVSWWKSADVRFWAPRSSKQAIVRVNPAIFTFPSTKDQVWSGSEGLPGARFAG